MGSGQFRRIRRMNCIGLALLSIFLLWCGVCLGADDESQGIQRGDPFIQGTLKLNGKTYRAVCNCNQGTLANSSFPLLFAASHAEVQV